MTAAEIARALGAKQASGGSWLVRCIAHDDRSPSLALRDVDGRVLAKCHAGCSQGAVIAALRERGLWSGSSSCSDPVRLERARAVLRRSEQERTEAALRIWRETLAA